jgi:hypothetical protein
MRLDNVEYTMSRGSANLQRKSKLTSITGGGPDVYSGSSANGGEGSSNQLHL